jgi:cytoskeletal protein RodZ
MGKKSKNKWIWWVVGIAAVGLIGWWVWKTYYKKSAAPVTGENTLSLADVDNASTEPTMLDLVRFLNLPSVRKYKVDPATISAATPTVTKRSTEDTPLYVSELAKLYTDPATGDPIPVGDWFTKYQTLKTDATTADKEAIKFNTELERRLNEALGIKTIADTSAAAIYAYAKTPISLTGTPPWEPNGTEPKPAGSGNADYPGTAVSTFYPSLTNIIKAWKADTGKYKANADS